jgi:hypothetical protein
MRTLPRPLDIIWALLAVVALLVFTHFAAAAPPVLTPSSPLRVSTGQSLSESNKLVKQPRASVAREFWGRSLVLKNFIVTQGCIVLSHSRAESITLENVGSRGYPNTNNKQPGCYAAIFWDSPAKSIRWDNSACKSLFPDAYKIHQSPNGAETAIRVKADKALFRSLFIVGLGKGHKPPVQVRSTKSGVVFEDCTFENGWVEVGRQKVGPVWDTSQYVSSSTFINCRFTLWTPAHKPVDRKPGTGKLVYINCTDPDGHKFSREN